jgi:hypothetical protein
MTGEKAGIDIVAATSFGTDDHRDRPAFVELGDAVGCGLLNNSAAHYAPKQQRGKNPTQDFSPDASLHSLPGVGPQDGL